MRRIVLAAACFLAPTSALYAQSTQVQIELERQLGTLSAQFRPEFANGKLTSCGIEFSVLIKDWAYKAGGLARVGGQFGLMSVNGQIGTILKVIVHDINLKTAEFKPSPPATAYFIQNKFQTSKSLQVSSFNSDTPGAIFIISKIDAFSFIAEGINHDKVTIAFARKVGGQDVQVVIETDVQDTSPDGTRKRDPKPAIDFFACAKHLLENAK